MIKSSIAGNILPGASARAGCSPIAHGLIARKCVKFRGQRAARLGRPLPRTFIPPLDSRQRRFYGSRKISHSCSATSTKEELESVEVVLPELTTTSEESPLDLLVVGCGPAGLGAASKASAKGLKVGLVDPAPYSLWPNNYGVWVDEFEELGLDDCFNRTWAKSRVVIENGSPEGVILDRQYAQVDRVKLKSKLLDTCIGQGVGFRQGKVDQVEHKDRQSVLVLDSGELLHARAVLDATGHSRRLVEFDRSFTPGYQAAFGILAEVESHPFPLDEMLFMDWRSDHLDESGTARNDKLPTFLYAMPFSPTLVFMEETSLVARPALEFDDLKDRMKQRLESLGVKVTKVVEEEYCLIPMGGVLPTLPQRALGIGGTAGMVHPSTGFMVSKTLASADVLVEELSKQINEDKSSSQIADAVWARVWPEQDKRVRTFMCFGMETLMSLDISGTRRFFSTFFSLPKEMWGGFLSWRIQPLGLVGLGLSLFKAFPMSMRFSFIISALPFMPSFILNFITGNNEFDSKPWSLSGSGLDKPEEDDDDDDDDGGGLASIPLPNPTANPAAIRKTSKLDFKELLGDQDMEKPSPASVLRDDRDWSQFQENKVFEDQMPMATILDPIEQGATLDVVVVGCGPAGLSIAAALADQGLQVGLVAPDRPFVNNYGVWLEEFKALGLEDALLNTYDDVLVWFDESDPAEGIGLGRQYGRVGRKELRDVLLARCKEGGVRYHAALVDVLENFEESGEVHKPKDASTTSMLHCDDGFDITSRLVVLSTGHNREMVQYESNDSPYGWQTAYGIEIKMPDHPFPENKAVFMDFRQSDPEIEDGSMWRVPSFLYVLPTDKDTFFLEETCLAARVQVPFDELKRRLLRRLLRMGLSVEPSQIVEEEASWIPLGGPLPISQQRNVAFGAAAGLVHPASGYSIVNTMSRAQPVAKAIAEELKNGTAQEAADAAWRVLWSNENRRQMAFHQVGMELIMALRLDTLREFFDTFFKLPRKYWQGFLSHKLTSIELLQFALRTFFIGTDALRYILVAHLFSRDKAGIRLLETYASSLGSEADSSANGTRAASRVERQAPPQLPASTAAVNLQLAREQDGVLTGFEAPNSGASASFWSDGNTTISINNTEQAIPGDLGFDPLSLGAAADLATYAEAELIHGRWAMLGTVGIIIPDCLSYTGIFGEGYHWWNAGFQLVDNTPTFFYLGMEVPLSALSVVALNFSLMAFAEQFRVGNLEFPGVKWAEISKKYPGGLFDPLGLAKSSKDDFEQRKAMEITYGRVAMLATSIFIMEGIMFHKGPIEVLLG
ncbi:hypothetical protein CYMTET_3931 [Cymbomonas tetramitiformis]|uniref:lycopene beta-cyclase n=1 Tax=Cymbomonas tetramitiformis TaxID=36881 RepID=A0AAE0H263_9CHLO|nr:hypothetical protein CYMTET_3931 [Cymbomonas tetramitiformis]